MHLFGIAQYLAFSLAFPVSLQLSSPKNPNMEKLAADMADDQNKASKQEMNNCSMHWKSQNNKTLINQTSEYSLDYHSISSLAWIITLILLHILLLQHSQIKQNTLNGQIKHILQ